MTEILSNIEIMASKELVAHDVGNAILDHTPIDGISRPFELGDQTYQTNLPPEITMYTQEYADQDLEDAGLSPSELDSLPAGTYHTSGIKEVVDLDEGGVKQEPVVRKLEIVDTDAGKAVTVESFSSNSWHLQPGTEKLMTALGYEISQQAGHTEIAAAPTPRTVEGAAAKLGVEIAFFPQHGFIPSKDYLGAFKDGKFPVALGQEANYKHDIEDDHLTALVLGGQPLQKALSEAARHALSADEATMNNTTRGIDEYTATLRAVIAPHFELTGAAFGAEAGRHTLYDLGEQFGIPANVSEAVLATAQQNARAFDIPVSDLL